MTDSSRTPLVSVIIPAYNVSEFIADAVRSALDQTFRDHEVIVVNDGSPDTAALEAALAPFRDRILYLVQENRGPSATRNLGIRSARGRYIAMLDADDMWLPHYLEDQIGRAMADPAADVLYGDAEIFGDVPQTGRRFMELSPSRGEVTFESLVTQRCNVMISALVRRAALDRVGLFDESLRSSEDFELWLRVAHAGGRFNYTRRVLARYRKRSGSLTSDPAWMCRHIVAVLDKCLATMDLSDAERRVATTQRAHFATLERFHEGKRAFFRGDLPAARVALAEANQRMRSPKLTVVLLALRTAPGLVSFLYNLRDRVVFRGARTKY
jgi:glycosyltransferase involved in cell wall biosynthesis